MDRIGDVSVTALVFGTVAFVMVVVLYVFYFTDWNERRRKSRAVSQFPYSIARVATTKRDGDIDVNDPPERIDGMSLARGDIILVKNQQDSKLNGLYEVAAGRGSKLFRLKRHLPCPREGTEVSVRFGTENSGSVFHILYDADSTGRAEHSDDLPGIEAVAKSSTV